jgi:hypothetical protein
MGHSTRFARPQFYELLEPSVFITKFTNVLLDSYFLKIRKPASKQGAEYMVHTLSINIASSIRLHLTNAMLAISL